MQPDSALLFAAGFGTRMAPLTDKRPKPLIEVAGRPLFDHALAIVRAAGIRRIVANTHYLADRMSAHLRQVGVTESFEAEILDTGGGLKAALGLLGGRATLTLNTDAVWTGPNPALAAMAAWDETCMDALMVLIPTDRARGHPGSGDFRMDESGRLSPGPGLVYSGLQIIRPAPVTVVPEARFGLYRVWQEMIGKGRLHGIVHRGGWCDVGRPANIALAERMLEEQGV